MALWCNRGAYFEMFFIYTRRKSALRADDLHHPTLLVLTPSSSPTIGPGLEGPKGQIPPDHSIIKTGYILTFDSFKTFFGKNMRLSDMLISWAFNFVCI